MKRKELLFSVRIDELRVLIEEFIGKSLFDGDIWSKQRPKSTGLE